MDFTYSNAFLQSSQRDILTQDGRRKSCLANDDVRSSFIYSSMRRSLMPVRMRDRNRN